MNIKNTEFRLLNLVEYQNWNADKTPAYFMVRDIFWDEGKIALSNGNILLPHPSMDMIKPIPLTDEWIIKFGLSKENGYPYKFNKGYLKIRNGVFFFKYHDIEVDLPFVHQLQNLNFALTGVELQVS
mgnify:FL=1